MPEVLHVQEPGFYKQKYMLTLIKFSEDDLYLGELDSQGEPNGFGIHKCPKDNMHVGYWLNGLQEGKGFTFFACGEIYGGEFV